MTQDDGFRRQTWQSGQTNHPDEAHTRAWSPQSNTGLLLWLIVAEPLENRGSVLPCLDGQVIGRRGDIRWHDPRMSREHARIRLMRNPDAPASLIYGIEPLNATNGVFINGHPIQRLTPIYENDAIEMGDTLFIVKVLQ